MDGHFVTSDATMKCSYPRNAGFTYLGLLILIAILGMVAAATVTAGSVMQRRLQEDELLRIGSQFQAAFKTYYESSPAGQRRYPSELADLIRDPRYAGVRRHLRKIYVDPLTGRAEWGIVKAPEGGIMGVYSLSEETPIHFSGFEPEFALFEGKTKYSEWVFTYTPSPTKRTE